MEQPTDQVHENELMYVFQRGEESMRVDPQWELVERPSHWSRNVSPGEVLRRLDAFLRVIHDIEEGLAGKRFLWGETQREAFTRKARDLGLHLVTRTWLKKHGYRLKKGAAPIGSGYYGAPLQVSADLYVLECHAVKVGQSPASKP